MCLLDTLYLQCKNCHILLRQVHVNYTKALLVVFLA